MSMSDECLALVENLNMELFERLGEDTPDHFIYQTTGYYDMILFDDHRLWDSDNDDREYREETDDYEPLETYIRRVFNGWVNELYAFKFDEV